MKFNMTSVFALRPKAQREGRLNWQTATAGGWLERKLDGYRMTIVRDMAGAIHCAGRQPHLNHWHQLLGSKFAHEVTKLPLGTVLDGELVVEGYHSTDVITAMTSRPQDLRFVPFAVPWYAGSDQRRFSRTTVQLLIRDLGFEPPEQYQPLPHSYADAAHEAAELGWEGMIAKLEHWDSWLKIKPADTIDCFITKVQPGVGKHDGRMGAVELCVYDGIQRRTVGECGTGFSDLERERPDWLGQVIEVEYSGLTSDHKLRHARFVCMRPDKLAEECSWDQLA